MKNLIILPDGTEIFSGMNETTNLRSTYLKQCVNSETELTLGSVHPSWLECKIQSPNGALNIAAGTEITLYKVDDAGIRHKVGLFTLEKPTRPSAHTYKITAYDRVSWLDKDLTEWLTSLDGWPYSVFDFAHMVAAECGLVLKNTSLLNGDYQIRKFTGQGITGRKLMEWIGQICAKFCRATPDGELEFAWYTRKYNVEIAPYAYTRQGTNHTVSFAGGRLTVNSSAVKASHDGAGRVTASGLVVVSNDGAGNLVVAVDDGNRTGLPFFANSLTYEDYETAPIERVRIRLTEDDVGVVYPDVAGNTYDITGNYLLTAENAEALQRVAEGVYKAVSYFRYTPCEVSVAANLGISAGDIIRITDRNGKTITACIMTRTQRGQRDTLECTGSPRRDSPTAANAESFKALNAKMLEVRKSIDGLNIKASNLNSKIDGSVEELNKQIAELSIRADGISASVASLKQETDENDELLAEEIANLEILADGISAKVTALTRTVEANAEQTQNQFAEVDVKADGISASVKDVRQQVDAVNGRVDANGQELAQVQEEMTAIRQTSREVSIQVQGIIDNGVSQVRTGMGYTFDDEGLKIQKPGAGGMQNKLDDTGMEVSRSGEVMLRADKDGVLATDVTVRNYLIVGDHSRFENYNNGKDAKRTACFWIEGGTE